MPFLIVSDIHGNREALEAVLADARGLHDRILCLGDLAGYGADPNFAVEWARSNVAAIVRGNHDKVCAGLESLYSYRPAARLAAEWSLHALSAENRAYLERLPRGPLPYEGFDLVHGSPLDEDEYLMTNADVEAIRREIETPLSFFGHTHLQGGFLIARNGVKAIDPRRALELEHDYTYLVNPGSVGQPRDTDPRAAYAIYSPRDRVVEFRRVAYDVALAAEKIRAAGLPETLAWRLSTGV
ncbi:MAG TPA: metallophosphoesterase family protein [Bryobacteraceae bacterium]|nr:metallophosphoesterase family protein [Bryobacteraceae bacterium]